MLFSVHHGSVWRRWMIWWWAVGTASIGCQQTTPPQRAAEQVYNGTETAPAELPAFIYPDEPPLVDRKILGQFLSQLGGNLKIIWLMGEPGQEDQAAAAALAAARDELRQMDCPMMGLFTGQARRWRTEVVPMLRAARANFPCAVVIPPAAAGIAVWLTGEPQRPQPGLFLVDRVERVIARFGSQPQQVQALIAEMKSGRITRNLKEQQVYSVRLRLIELDTGEVSARAVASAVDLQTLADDLAGQLVAVVRDPGKAAVLPLRQIGQAKPADAENNQLLMSKLMAQLITLGWPSLVDSDAAQRTIAELGLNVLAVEFDTSRLAQRVPWRAILVGSIEQQALINK